MTSTTSNAAESKANRAGARTGKVSELTVIVPLKQGGAEKLRDYTARNPGLQSAVEAVGSIHDLRYVIFDNDTRLLFATTYDGDWDSYIDDFAASIPTLLDAVFGNAVGYPGIKSPAIKDYIVGHQVTAVSFYSAYPDLRVTDIRRAQRVAGALDQLLDAVNP